MKPEDIDFQCSADWRVYYNEQCESRIDFKCSAQWRAYYASKGMMPADYPPEPPERVPPTPRARQLPAKPRARKVKRTAPTPRLKGVIRERGS